MTKKYNDAENEVYRFIKILVVIVILILGFYLLTNAIAEKNDKKKDEATEVEISSSNIIVGTMFNRPYKEYYVIAYKSKANDSTIYDTYVSMYKQKENALNIYFVDLDNELNKKYYSEKGNPNAKTFDDIKLSSPTLIKISDKKIVKYIENVDGIKKELGL